MSIFDQISGRKFLIICALTAILLYVFYLDDIGINPPGFYLDESFISYQAYLISQTGRNEYGEFLPTYFPVFQKEDGTFDGYANPTYIYALATLNLIFPPSILLSKTFSATVIFLACLLLGWLASLMSGRPIVGVIIAFTALLTPWFFELSRLVFEVALYPLAVVLFLTALFGAHRAKKWTLIHCLLVAVGLALVTYSYSIGRLLGPVFALGLFLFVVDKRRLTDVFKTLGIYTVLLLPAVFFVFQNPGAMTQRYSSLSYFKDEMSFVEKTTAFIQAYFTDIGFQNLLYSGDANLRHHIPVMGMLFAASLLMGVIGLGFAVIQGRKDPWYRFLIFGLLVSVVPGALTLPRAHMLRLSTFPIFLIVLAVPALVWLIGGNHDKNVESFPETVQDSDRGAYANPRYGHFGSALRIAALAIFLGSIAIQAVLFQTGFRERGPSRGHAYDDAYPAVLAEAIVSESRPIFLEDGFWGPAYIHAYYYSVVQGVDRSIFVHLAPRERPPSGSIVLSSEDKCKECDVITKRGSFMLYRTQ